MHRLECSFAHMWFEEKVTEGLVDKQSFSWVRLYSENENVSVCIFQKGDSLCQRPVISKANSLSITFSSVTQSCPTLCDPMNYSRPGLPVHHQLREFNQTHVIESVMPSSHLILCHPLLLLPSVPPSIRLFSTTLAFLKNTPTYSNWNYKGQSLDYVWASCI